MMNDIGPWIVPLGFLPGVALLIMSTSARFTALSAEIRALLEGCDETLARQQLHRSHLLSQALVFLYISVTLLTGGVMVAGVVSEYANEAHWIIHVTLCLAVLLIVIAALHLVRESWLAHRIVHQWGDQLKEEA